VLTTPHRIALQHGTAASTHTHQPALKAVVARQRHELVGHAPSGGVRVKQARAALPALAKLSDECAEHLTV
jgi:hypothetical protein